MPMMEQLELILRLFVASICGAAIGLERENHMKTAGIRTHLIVSLASALMMVVSKYGFFDLVEKGLNYDASRIAAGVVTAVGFLGAGVIFVRKQNVSGITTSAGIWATVGVGIAIGAGMYLIGAVTTAMIILVHLVLQHKSKLIKETMTEHITLVLSSEENIDDILSSVFTTRNIDIINLKIKRLKEDKFELRLFVKYPDSYEIVDITQLLKDVPNIIEIEV